MASLKSTNVERPGSHKESCDHSQTDSEPTHSSETHDDAIGTQPAYVEEIKAGPSRPSSALRRFASTSSAGRNLIAFEPDDPGNPYNWSQLKKVTIVLVGIVTVLNSTLASSIPSGDLDPISQHFGVTSQEQQVLPNSIFLCGYVFGPLLFSPLSESYGRRIIFVGTYLLFFVFTLATPFSPNWTGFLFFRFLAGTFACSPISIIGGIYADLYNGPVARGRAMALFMTATTWGPVGGPIASGFLSPYSWRWPFWFMLIFSAASIVPVVLLPETYGPVILQWRARKMRKRDPTTDVWAPLDFEKSTWHDLIVTFLGRPFRMILTEPLVTFTCLFMSFIYGVFYILLIAYPQIYPAVYGFTLGEEGLTFLPIGIGALIACAIYLWWDHHLCISRARGKTWAHSEEFRRLPLACIGGPFFAGAMFWVGWSARKNIHWIVPALSGVPLGIGYLLLFMSLLNYIVDAYEIFAASGLAAAACTRSTFGVVLPFATTPMYRRLGIQWACSLLGFLSVGFCAIPFLFLRYGDRIRAKSKFCQELAEKRRIQQEKGERRKRRRELESLQKEV